MKLLYEIFSKRQKRIRGEVPDVYQCETIPTKLRVQVVYIWKDIFGEIGYSSLDGTDYAYQAYKFIHDKLCSEYGIYKLYNGNDPYKAIVNFFHTTKDVEKVLDVIEVSFRCIDPDVCDDDGQDFTSNIPHGRAIDKLNHCLREHSVGYQYESGQIIKVDSQFVHSEAVKPAMSLLSGPMYKGANKEFLKAHEHYRNRNYKDCVNNCFNAFESCLKIICQKNNWSYSEKDSANRLIGIVFDNGLIPPLMQSHFKALRSTLESGVPTIRNNWTGHGQGPEKIVVPEYIASYILNLTASNILLLAKADEDMNSN